MALSAKKPTPPSPSEIQRHLEQLGTAAKTLNDLSDQLTREVCEIESAINRLNLGVSAGVEIESWSDEDGMCSGSWRLVYGKERQKWGFLVLYESENLRVGPEADHEESWAFKDSPREQRLKAVERIPLLLEALLKTSTEVASQITNKVEYAKILAASFQPASESKE